MNSPSAPPPPSSSPDASPFAEDAAFYDAFEALARQEYPSLSRGDATLARALISPFEVRMTSEEAESLRETVRAFSALREQPAYPALLAPLPTAAQVDHGNRSVLMGYDFHLTPQGPKLIEINTNAGFALGAELRHRFALSPTERSSYEARERILETFWEEWQAARGPTSGPRPRVLSIIDEAPQEQNFYAEFLMFRDLFEAQGVEVIIGDPSDLSYDGASRELRGNGGRKKIDFIYNRSTDFYLGKDSHAALREAWLSGAVVLSPNPREYALLADKQRLIDWSTPGFLERTQLGSQEISAIRRVLEPARDLAAFPDAESLWRERKNLFFKPKNAYGGKAVYKGASLSQGKFQEILSSGDYVVQSYIPAGTLSFGAAGSSDAFKHDIRCYAYRGETLLIAARLYQGQVTNFRSPRGGFAPVLEPLVVQSEAP